MESENKNSVIKTRFFLELFGIPSICFSVLAILGQLSPDEPGEEATTWFDFILGLLIILIAWFIISFIITLIVNKIKGGNSKSKIVKEEHNMVMPEEKIVVKPNDMKEEIKKEIKEEIQQEIKKESKKRNSGKCLYTCKSIVDGYEYKKMAKYFPNRMYWVFVIRGSFLNIIIAALIAIISKSWIATVVFLIVYEIYLLIYYKVRLESVSEKVFNNRKKHGEIDINFDTEFFEDYFVRKGEKSSVTINYSEISRCVENDTNFYLEYPPRNMIIIIQKNGCDLELINFIRSKFNNIDNFLGDNSNYKGVKKYHNPKVVEALMIILFIITIASYEGAMWTLNYVNKITNPHLFSFTKTSWVVWCWLPIPITSIILGYKYKRMGYKCKKNIIAGFIVGILLFINGLFTFFPTYEEDYNNINLYKNYISATLPSTGELHIMNWGTYFDEDKTNYTIINAYYDKENVARKSVEDLVSSIKNNSNWMPSKEIKSELRVFIPSQLRTDDDAYFSIYNKTTNQYNTLPEATGNYEIYAMKYDISEKHLEIHKFDYLYR